jgi:hypothetical protein
MLAAWIAVRYHVSDRSRRGRGAYRNILGFLGLFGTLTVLDDCVHVDFVGGGKSDLVSLPVFVSTRLFEYDLDLGLLFSFGESIATMGLP